jgi:hypothetical protein
MWLFYCFITFVCLYCSIHFYSIVTISTSYEFVLCMHLWKIMNKLKLKCILMWWIFKEMQWKIIFDSASWWLSCECPYKNTIVCTVNEFNEISKLFSKKVFGKYVWKTSFSSCNFILWFIPKSRMDPAYHSIVTKVWSVTCEVSRPVLGPS